MNCTSKIFLLIFITLFAMPSFAMDTDNSSSVTKVQWHEWSNETFALAAEQNKLILLDISAQWCQFCKKMKAVTYQNPDVVKIINDNYIAINADIETTDDVKRLYSHFGVPGTIILTPERDEINKRLGYIAPQQMQWHLLGSLQDAPSYDISANTNTD